VGFVSGSIPQPVDEFPALFGVYLPSGDPGGMSLVGSQCLDAGARIRGCSDEFGGASTLVAGGFSQGPASESFAQLTASLQE
jgi:hypothetical protein